MRISWLIGALVTFIIGVVFILAFKVIGIVVSIPLFFVSFVILIIGLFLKSDREREKSRKNRQSNREQAEKAYKSKWYWVGFVLLFIGIGLDFSIVGIAIGLPLSIIGIAIMGYVFYSLKR